MKLAHLYHLFLESEGELGASVGKGSRSVGDVLQPLDDERGRDTERKIPYHMKVRRIYERHTKRFSSKGLVLRNVEEFHPLTIFPRLSHARRESAVHSVGQYVAVDDPQLSWCCLRQQLWTWIQYHIN